MAEKADSPGNTAKSIKEREQHIAAGPHQEEENEIRNFAFVTDTSQTYL
jgi:hypothetical protein